MGKKLDGLFSQAGIRYATITMRGSMAHEVVVRLQGYPDGNQLLPGKVSSLIDPNKEVWGTPPIAVTSPIQFPMAKDEPHGQGLIPQDGWGTVSFMPVSGSKLPWISYRNTWIYPGLDTHWYYHWWQFTAVSEPKPDTYAATLGALKVAGASFAVTITIGAAAPRLDPGETLKPSRKLPIPIGP
jgi:hypothetical protein